MHKNCLHMPGWERLQNNINTEHALPQQLALFSETSVTWGPITPYRRAATTAGAKPSSATTCLYLPHSFIALRYFVLPLTQICLSVGVLTPQLLRGSLAEMHRHFRQTACTHLTQPFTFSPLQLPRKQKPSEIALQCAYKVFNSVFAVFSSYWKNSSKKWAFPWTRKLCCKQLGKI